MPPRHRASTPQFLLPEGAQFGRDNLVLHAIGSRHVVKDFPGPLSIKSVLKGQVTWTVGGRNLVVDTGSFLVLNDGEKYSMDLDSTQRMETCCAFFSHGFVEEIAQDATSPLEASFDDPTRRPPPLTFLSRLHADPAGSILPALQSLAERCSGQLRPSGFEEEFLILSERLVMLYQEIALAISRVPASRASTREELFRRLQLAREYIHGCADQPISLKDVSRQACLSRYHLHRAFTRAFQQTPHGYLTTLRLERARGLLKAGHNATETCVEVGFSSLSSFSRLFRGRFGVPPSSIRKDSRAGNPNP